jgi:uncharacterized protein YdaU (DUF1376 family)
MPLYIGDYLGDTPRLTTEQHGAYLLLLMDYWRNGPPPADDDVLCQITRLSRSAWRKMKPSILQYFIEENGLLKQGRAERELANARGNQERRSAKAKKAASARWTGGDHAPGNAPSMPEALLGGCPPPSPSPISDTSVSEAAPSTDWQTRVFRRGEEVLGHFGIPAKQARSLVGRWRKKISDERLYGLLDEAIGKANAVEWITAAVRDQDEGSDALFRSIDLKYGHLPPRRNGFGPGEFRDPLLNDRAAAGVGK